MQIDQKLTNKRKIIVRILGGLGNQLFNFSAARRLALINNAELVIDNISGFTFDSLYKRKYQLDHFNIICRKATVQERLEPLPRLRRLIMRRWNYLLPFEQRKYLFQEKIDYDKRLLNFRPVGTVYLEGYWQSEDYFKDVEEIIRQDLRITPPKDAANLDMAMRILSCESVSLHVRFFDEHNEQNIVNNLSEDYYKRAVELMEKINPNSHYFIFSDNPNAARMRIPLANNRITLVAHNQGDENAYADLWLMTQCKNFIVANSTFSWWGAWLSNYPFKHVIAPGFETRQGKTWWGFKGLLPTEWIKL